MYKSDRPYNIDFLKKCHNTEKYDIMSAEEKPKRKVMYRHLEGDICFSCFRRKHGHITSKRPMKSDKKR